MTLHSTVTSTPLGSFESWNLCCATSFELVVLNTHKRLDIASTLNSLVPLSDAKAGGHLR